jgi:hypothetical protein
LRKKEFTPPERNEGIVICDEEDEPKRGRSGGESEDGPNVLGDRMDWSQENYSVRWPLGLTITFLAAAKICIVRERSKITRGQVCQCYGPSSHSYES